MVFVLTGGDPFMRRDLGAYGDWLAEDPACVYVPPGYQPVEG